MFDFENFNVYQRSEQFYCEVLKILKNKEIDKELKDQLKRASMSIVLNIAEWAWKYSKNDKKNFYVIARWSVNECVAIYRILKLENKILDIDFNTWYNLMLEIAKMLSSLISSIINNK